MLLHSSLQTKVGAGELDISLIGILMGEGALECWRKLEIFYHLKM